MSRTRARKAELSRDKRTARDNNAPHARSVSSCAARALHPSPVPKQTARGTCKKLVQILTQPTGGGGFGILSSDAFLASRRRLLLLLGAVVAFCFASVASGMKDDPCTRAKEARAASRRARSAGPVTMHAHVTGPSHTSRRVGNGLYTLYTHICPQGTTACVPGRAALEHRRPLGGDRGGAGAGAGPQSVTPLARCRVHLGPASWGDAPRVPRVRYY